MYLCHNLDHYLNLLARISRHKIGKTVNIKALPFPTYVWKQWNPPRRLGLFIMTNDTILYTLHNANDAEIPASTETETRCTFKKARLIFYAVVDFL
ncbi:hypothetical protein CEXT_545921 [Caerostris extrusa]|uniref:Uncharacterized protein n=1 Tax=Caerostris extrusa TaxID=172846 RepID=A0AAV4P227_CAEEX|nr:hypothetical protein CEXT_545921 [Caerostris extrusa]